MSRLPKHLNKTNGGLTVIGKISCGAAPDGPRDFPRSFGHFELQNAAPNLVSAFKDHYGDKPTEIGVVFLSESHDVNCNEYLVCHKQGKEVWRLEGNVIHVFKPNIGTVPTLLPDPKTDKAAFDDELTKYRKMGDSCTTVLEMKFGLVIKGLAPQAGCFSFSTKAAYSIDRMRDTYDLLAARAHDYGASVVGVPFFLSVVRLKSNGLGSTNVYNRYKLSADLSRAETVKETMFMADTSRALPQIKTAKGLDSPQSPLLPPSTPFCESVRFQIVDEDLEVQCQSPDGETWYYTKHPNAPLKRALAEMRQAISGKGLELIEITPTLIATECE